MSKNKSGKDSVVNNLKAGFSKTSIPQRIVLFLFVGIFIVFIVSVLTFWLTNDDGDIVVNNKKLSGKEVSNQGAVVVVKDEALTELKQKQEQAKALAAEKRGQSSFMPLIAEKEIEAVAATPSSDELPIAQPVSDKPAVKVKLPQPAPKKKPVIKDKPESEEPPKSKPTISDSDTLGLPRAVYNKLLEKRIAEKKKDLQKAVMAYKSTRQVNSQAFAQIKADDGTQNARSSLSSDAKSKQLGAVDSNLDEPIKDFVLEPGDKIYAYTDTPIDSRINNKFIMRVTSDGMKDARVICSFRDAGDFLIPLCNEIYYKKKNMPIVAVALNPNDFKGIVDQDVDGNLFLSTVTNVSTEALRLYGAAKLKNGSSTTFDAQGKKVSTTYNNTDDNIVQGAIATGVSTVSNVLKSLFSNKKVKSIPMNSLMILSFHKPVENVWQTKVTTVQGSEQ